MKSRFMDVAGYYWIPLGLAAYYLLAWLVVGRKPRRQSIVVHYRPPGGLSPATMRYLFRSSCDGRTFAAVLVQLAARSAIFITPRGRAVYLSRKQSDRHEREGFSDEEQLVLKKVFQWEESEVELRTPNPGLVDKLEELLKSKTKTYFKKNVLYIAIAVGASGLAAAWLSWSLQLFGDDVETIVLTSFTGLTVGIFIAASVYLWDRNFQALKLAFRGLYHKRVIPLLFFFVFLFPAMWYLLMRSATPIFANITALLILINMFAAPALRSYTPAGKQLLLDIVGFRQFLQSVEQDRMQRLNRTGQAMQAEQEFLPYAVALDVREDWGDELGIRAMIETAL